MTSQVQQKIDQVQTTLPSLGEIVQTTITSEVFLGLLALSVGGFVVYTGRAIFGRLWKMIKRYCSVSVTIRSHESDTYLLLIRWFNYKRYHKWFRNFRVESYPPDSNEVDCKGQIIQTYYYPGDGTFVIFYQGRPMIINKTTKETKQIEPPEEFTITIPALNKRIASDLINEIKSLDKHSDKVKVYEFDSDIWMRATEKEPRTMDTVYLDQQTKDDVIQDIQWFKNNKQWYKQRGIPYYRGYLFYGPPGTGKTTLSYALASYFNMKLCIVNLNNIDNDSKLQRAFTELPANSILVIEDVDVMSSAQARNKQFTQDAQQTDDDEQISSQKTAFGVTLSGLLNAMDGITSTENRLTIMTTNNPGSLDQALTRDGRVDKKVYLSYCDRQVKKHMFETFFPEYAEYGDQFVQKYPQQMTPAELQGLFIRHTQTPEKLLGDDNV